MQSLAILAETMRMDGNIFEMQGQKKQWDEIVTDIAEVIRSCAIRSVIFAGIRNDRWSIPMVMGIFRHIERYEDTENHVEASCCTFSDLLRLAVVSDESGGQWQSNLQSDAKQGQKKTCCAAQLISILIIWKVACT